MDGKIASAVPTQTAFAVLESFAQALDHDQFEAAKRYLSHDCVYRTPSRTFNGPAEIIESFKESSSWAHSNIERVTFVHIVEDCGDCSRRIRFFDLLEHNGMRFRHVCLMHSRLNDQGLITELKLEDLPGEKEKVNEFFARVGIVRR